ncbi:MAG: hypothetical protein LBD37_10790 [Treponema sp.]|jgi:hypothetical protein|nr:hypothetical protein [Treponema sp.]
MKKSILVLVLAAGGVLGQEWYDSYAPGIDAGNVFINAGIGLGPTGGYDMGVPPLSVSADFKPPVKPPITIGGIFTFLARISAPGTSLRTTSAPILKLAIAGYNLQVLACQ